MSMELGILQRLGSGRSIDEFQHNLLEELRSVLKWDHALPISSELPTTCASGLWRFTDVPCQTCQDWCKEVIEREVMEECLLFMLNLKSPFMEEAQERSSLGLLLLRRDRAFEAPEVQTLSQIQQALQALLDQSNVLDLLIQQDWNSDGMQVEVPRSLMDPQFDQPDRPDPLCTQQLLQLGLTPRQAEVIHLMMKGKETSAIALHLGCREATVRKHLENLYRRFGVQTRTAAIAHILGKIGVV